MPWTKDQIRIHAMACREVKISEEHRKLILRQFSSSMYDELGQPTGEPSSKSARLNNSDFEQFMAIVERSSVKAHEDGPGKVLSYEPGYWSDAAERDMRRMRHLVVKMDAVLIERGAHTSGGLLHQIQKMGGEAKTELKQLDYSELHNVINALRAVGKRHRIDLSRVI